MNEMLDRAERAIRAHRHNTTEVQAREAIRAIREPSEEMLEAGRCGMAYAIDNRQPAEPCDRDCLPTWHDMIDVILGGR